MEYNKAIDQFITYLLEPHEERTLEGYPNSIFWIKGGEVIVEIKKTGYFWLRYTTWIRISQMFGLDYYETQSVIKVWLEEHYNLGVLTPEGFMIFSQHLLEEHYNLGVLTPHTQRW